MPRRTPTAMTGTSPIESGPGLALAFILAGACSGATTQPPRAWNQASRSTRDASQRERAHANATSNGTSNETSNATAAAAQGAPHFSTLSRAPAVLLATLHYAVPTAIRAHPSGDLIVAGCTEGPTDLLPTVDPQRVLAFVARVEPGTGSIRWVRHLPLATEAFENGCSTHRGVGDRGAGMTASTHVVVTDEGAIDVAALASATSQASGAGASSPSALVLSLDPSDGTTRWQREVARADQPAFVNHLLADGSGVAALVRHVSADGLDSESLLRFDRDGHVVESPLLHATAMRARRTPCHPGVNGCRLGVERVWRADDGSIGMYGAFAGVDLTLGATSIHSTPDGTNSDGFWAVVASDGAPRSLRGGAPVITSIVRAHEHQVAAVVHAPSNLERIEVFDAATGANHAWTGADPAWHIAQVLQLHGAIRRSFVGATMTDGAASHPVAPRDASALDVAALRELSQSDPEIDDPRATRLADGTLAAIVTLHGTLSVSGATTPSTTRSVRCHPGHVGAERPQTPDCRETLARPSAVVVVWPPALR